MVAPALRSQEPAGPSESLRLALVSLPDGSLPESAARGVTLGVEEASRTGALVGGAIELRTTGARGAAALIREWRPSALIGGFDLESVRAGAALAEQAGIPFLNIGATDDVLRGAGCSPVVWHVAASEGMKASALATDGAASRTVLWHPVLERYGAAQLNDRYRARFAAEMDELAWAGWMAVKVLWEASLRARSTEPAALVDHLRKGSTQFDGHKGWPLSFRPWDHQLRQPLYLVDGVGAAARVIAEAPTRAEGSEIPARELLDRFGAKVITSTCARIPQGTP